MARGRLPARHAGWLLLASLWGCTGGDDVASCVYRVCDVSTSACIEAISKAVACARDEDVLSPAVRFVRSDELLAEIEADDEPLSAEELATFEDLLRARALVGLMPDGYEPSELTADSLRNVWGFYYDGEIVVITDHASDDRDQLYLLMVHEMVHAYQDARWDLGAHGERHATSRDRSLARRALVEGEAEWLTLLAALDLERLSVDDVRWTDYFEDWQSQRLERAAETDTPLIDASMDFPYAWGAHFVYDAWRDGGQARIGELYAEPPESVRQVMAGYAAWPDGAHNGDGELAPSAVPVLGDSDEALGGSFYGVWLLNAMMQRTAGTGKWAAALDDVQADFLTVVRDVGAGSVGTIWRVRSEQAPTLGAMLSATWARPEDADAGSHLQMSIDGDLLLVASSDGDAAALAARIQGWAHPEDVWPAEEANPYACAGDEVIAARPR